MKNYIMSRTEIKGRMKRKTNYDLVETIREANKNERWNGMAKILSGPTRMQSSLNLFQIDEKTSAGDTIIIPGRVLSKGELTKKIRICSLGISKQAREKLKKTKSEFAYIKDEIKINPKAEGVKILR